VTPDAYCREIEGYLTRKNDGHLVRIVGPSFDRVRGWAEQGVPLKVAFAGIDRYFERYYAKGPRRRPVRIDHCEADILDVFDDWRRAVGVTTGHRDDERAQDVRERRRDSLPTKIERAVARLTALRGGDVPPLPGDVLEQTIAELDRIAAGARAARGQARDALVERLRDLDRRLLLSAREAAGPGVVEALRVQAALDLEPFRDRMRPAAWEQALDAAVERAVRDRARLPALVVE
jgi:hypothetical protein